MKNQFGSFFGLWGTYFVRFMLGLGGQIVLAILYVSLGIAFLAVWLDLPPNVVSAAVNRNGGMTLFLLIVSVAMAVEVGVFTVNTFVLGNDNKHDAQTPPATAQKEAV